MRLITLQILGISVLFSRDERFKVKDFVKTLQSNWGGKVQKKKKYKKLGKPSK